MKTSNENQFFNKLFLQVREGDAIAFEKLFLSLGPIIANRLLYLIKIPEIVEDIQQEIFLRLWTNKQGISEDTNIKAYLLTAARNASIDFLRKASKDQDLIAQLKKYTTFSYNHVETFINRNEESKLLIELLSLLPPQRRKIFESIKLHGKSYQETAEEFNVSINTVKDHMRKAMNTLKQEVENRKFIPFLIFLLNCYL